MFAMNETAVAETEIEAEIEAVVPPVVEPVVSPVGSSNSSGPSVSQTPGADPTESAEAEMKSAPDQDQVATAEQLEAKRTRAPRAPKAPAKSPEAGSVAIVVERVVRLTLLGENEIAALGRLLNVGVPDDQVARLTRLTAVSLGAAGKTASEALAIVIGLEAANPIHVGVQLGRLAATALPDVYRCIHALTGETAPALAKGDQAVFAVADVLATLTPEAFTLAQALRSALD
jgi:hypothetical protein